MSVYTVNDNTVNNGALTLSEQALYGSSRLGLYKPALNLVSYTAPSLISMNGLGSVGYNNNFTRGKKFFELNNHLGNVLVTVTDKKTGVDGNNDLTIDYYLPDIVSANSYYPFGMQMPGRNYNVSNSAYGFNGKRKDNEIYGEGNFYDYGMRGYDPRAGRFWGVDPLTKKYPWYSPYQFAGNKPIWAADLDGMEEWMRTQQNLLQQGVQLQIQIAEKQKQMAAQKAAQALANQPVFRQADNSVYAQQRSNEYAQQAWRNQVYANAEASDPVAAGVGFGLANTSVQTLRAPVDHSFGVYFNIKDGNYWGAAGNAALLALDASPFLLKGSTTAVTSNIPTRIARIFPEKFAGSLTLGAPGAADIFVTDANAIKGITNSTDLAKKLTLIDNNGNLIKGPFRVVEFDTPSSGLASPFNRGTPGFINGGKTAGGAPEYVLPNLQVKDLKNVTQTTVN